MAIKKIFMSADDVQDFFDDMLKGALNYKFQRTSTENSKVLINSKDITEAIFNLTIQDKIKICDQTINGLRIKELFVATIYLRYLVSTLENKFIIIAFPFQEADYDIAFFALKKNNYTSPDNKFRIPRDSTAYYIQIKENFDYEEYKKFNETNEPKKFNSSKIEKTATRYDNVLILFFNRNHSLFESGSIKPFLEKNKNVGIILMPSLANSEIKLLEGKDKGKTISLEKEKFNFLLETEDKTIHIKFGTPKFIVKANSELPE